MADILEVLLQLEEQYRSKYNDFQLKSLEYMVDVPIGRINDVHEYENQKNTPKNNLIPIAIDVFYNDLLTRCKNALDSFEDFASTEQQRWWAQVFSADEIEKEELRIGSIDFSAQNPERWVELENLMGFLERSIEVMPNGVARDNAMAFQTKCKEWSVGLYNSMAYETY